LPPGFGETDEYEPGCACSTREPVRNPGPGGWATLGVMVFVVLGWRRRRARLDLDLARKKIKKVGIHLKGPLFVGLQKNREHAQPSAKEPFR